MMRSMNDLNQKHIYLKELIKICLGFFMSGLLIFLLPLIIFLRLVRMKIQKNKPISIWTGAPIINMVSNSLAEKRLGFQSKTIVYSAYFITNKFDVDIFSRSKKNYLIAFLTRYAIFVWLCVTADRVHAYVDGGFLKSKQRSCFNRLELFFYSVLKIKLFIWTYGADVRSRNKTLSLGEPNCCTDCSSVKKNCICDDLLASQNYRRVTRVAKAIFSMGDMIEYTPKSRNDLFFWPVDLTQNAGDRYRPFYPIFSDTKPLSVVHASNHRHFKGSKYLEAAINELRDEGIAIELRLVEGIPNEQALLIYRSADLIFDQCLIGFHGYFAIEAMALGKPVMCFIRHPEKYLLASEQCPIINIHRDTLKDTLRKLATTDRVLLTDIGRKSRAYIEQYYTIDAFAQRLNKCYKELGVSV